MAYPQSSYNFFKNDYTNHPVAKDLSNYTDSEKLRMDLYLRSTKYPTMTGLSKVPQSPDFFFGTQNLK